jgi:hypothetical protein
VDAVVNWGGKVIGILLLVGWAYAIAQGPPKPRNPPAYCIDPFATADLGMVVYTHCKLVPMWSMKV